MTTNSPSSTGHGIQYVKVYAGQHVYAAAQERIAHIFDMCDTPVVSFSGGKDSTCLLHLALDEARRRGRTLDVVHVDEEIIDPDTEAYLLQVRDLADVRFHWVCVPIRHTLRAETRTCWYPWDPTAQSVWFRAPPLWAITDVPGFVQGTMGITDVIRLLFPKRTAGQVCEMTAIRARESFNRVRCLLQAGSYLSRRGARFYGKPIYDWETLDVWRFIRDRALPYSGIYDKMQREGVALHNQRLAPWGNVAAARETYRWAIYYPEAWDRALQRLPELRPQAHYGRTKLYRKNIEKPLGLTWQEWVFILINDFDEAETRAYWARYVRDSLKRWARKYSIPFPEEPVIVDGKADQHLSWKKLAAIIVKNDRHSGMSRDRL